jgi:hypothetical protein
MHPIWTKEPMNALDVAEVHSLQAFSSITNDRIFTMACTCMDEAQGMHG